MITFAAIGLMMGCSPQISSLVFINEDYKTVQEFYSNEYYSGSDFLKRYEVEDTIIIGFYHERQPMESLFIFENDTCYFQQTNIYCSPCADQSIEKILSDNRYKFKVIDAVNYRSEVDPRIIMRLKRSTDEDGTCNELTITRTSLY